MSDWNFLNKHRTRVGPFGSDDSYGWNGQFWINLPRIETKPILIMSSDGMGWRHVSVSFGGKATRCPSWDVMCAIKDLFWEPDDVVIQFHPRKQDYVNFHKGCLHLWQCIDGREQPTPPPIMVGPQYAQEKTQTAK